MRADENDIVKCVISCANISMDLYMYSRDLTYSSSERINIYLHTFEEGKQRNLTLDTARQLIRIRRYDCKIFAIFRFFH